MEKENEQKQPVTSNTFKYVTINPPKPIEEVKVEEPKEETQE